TGNPQTSGSKWKQLREKLFAEDGEHMLFEVVGENKSYRKPQHEEVDPEELYDETKTTEIKEEATYKKISPSTLKSSSKISEDPLENEGNIEVSDETYSTLIGTMVHRLMEMIIMSRDRLSKEDLVDNIMTEYMTAEMENYDRIFRKTLGSVYDKMHNGGYPQINGAIQNILPELLEAEEIYSEVPFTCKEEDDIWNGIIDLIYRKYGKLHIIDWKTNRNAEGLAEHYKGQLDAYRKAVRQMTGEDVEDAFIYQINIYQ
ncbi:MAG: PD-(D/E)XK nuclease family protein, partial [Erysipelotrichaceae bacterium]|nr:PD-(D/E)XK nuclease family protein [Erysipelotrichaceae bacterium]